MKSISMPTKSLKTDASNSPTDDGMDEWPDYEEPRYSGLLTEDE